MTSGPDNRGFTIVETLMFLAVSAVIFAGALALLGGAQNRTMFNQAVGDFEQRMIDTINTVSSGYYSSRENFSCDYDVAGPKITSANRGQGTNTDCTFLGKVIRFEDGDSVDIMTITGLRYKAVGTKKLEPETLAEAKPKSVFLPGPIDSDLVEHTKLKNGLTVKWIGADGQASPVGAIAFLTNLGKYRDSTQTALSAGGQQIDYYGIESSSLGTNLTSLAGIIDGDSSKIGYRNSTGGINICADSGTTDKHVHLLIGGGGRQTNTSVKVGNGKCGDIGTHSD